MIPNPWVLVTNTTVHNLFMALDWADDWCINPESSDFYKSTPEATLEVSFQGDETIFNVHEWASQLQDYRHAIEEWAVPSENAVALTLDLYRQYFGDGEINVVLEEYL